jgi:hypothetical protein
MNVEIDVQGMNADVVQKKEKKETILGKNKKMMVFGNWLLGRLQEMGIVENVEDVRVGLKMFDTATAQNEFYNQFWEESKTAEKDMREIIKENKKKETQKEKKEKKNVAFVAKEGTEAKKKGGRKKKEQVIVEGTAQDAIIADMVALARQEPEKVETEPVSDNVVVVVAPVKEKKPRATAPKKKPETDVAPTSVPVVVTTTETVAVTPAPKEKKPKASKKKVVEEPEEDVDLTPIDAQDVTYLINEKNNDIYDYETYVKIGTYNEDDETVTLFPPPAPVPVKETKPKANKKKVPEPKPVVVTQPEPEPEPELEEGEEVEIDVNPIEINGVSYLINEKNNDIYDCESQEKIGTFNEDDGTVTLF